MKYEYSKDKVFTETLEAPDYIQFEDSEAECTVFIDQDDNVTELDKSLYFKMGETVAETVSDIQKSLSEKSFEGSNQTQTELEQSGKASVEQLNVVPTPYDPGRLATFLEINEVHFRAMETRVSDSVGREFQIKSKYPIQQADADLEDSHGNSVTQEEFEKDCKIIQDFIDNSNSVKDFEQITSLVAMDRIAVGWGGFEVIRSANGQISKLNHVPAVRLRVIEGWAGFAEEVGYNAITKESKYTYYQPFGQKVGKLVPDPFDPDKTVFSPYNPERDGELDMAKSGLVWNYKDKETGKSISSDTEDPTKQAKNFASAANEIVYLPNDHINTIYYGYADVVPAIGAILANVYIRDYLLQFLANNCIPRYVVIIKGAKVDEKFKKYITEYFKKKLKGDSYNTMILSLSGLGNKNIDIEFKQISTEHKEMDFMDTKKENDQVIITADGVSAAVLGINETASLGSGKGLSQAEMYKNRVVVPSQLFWERKLNNLFKFGLGVLNAVIKFDPLDVKDALDVAQTLQLMLLNGTMTINEARREVGMAGPLKGGDVAFVRIREGSFVKIEDIPSIQTQLSQEGASVDGEGNVEDVTLELESDNKVRELQRQIEELQAAVNNLT